MQHQNTPHAHTHIHTPHMTNATSQPSKPRRELCFNDVKPYSVCLCVGVCVCVCVCLCVCVCVCVCVCILTHATYIEIERETQRSRDRDRVKLHTMCSSQMET